MKSWNNEKLVKTCATTGIPCKELDIEIIEIAVNPDHVHIFFKYPPKYSLSLSLRD